MRDDETIIRIRIRRDTLAQINAVCDDDCFGRPVFAGRLLERAFYLYQLGGAKLFWGHPIESGTWDEVADTVSAKLRELEGPPVPDNLVEFPQTAE